MTTHHIYQRHTDFHRLEKNVPFIGLFPLLGDEMLSYLESL